tara:strand:- start:565 stop:1008 length:444 start_codon:yes stop_codon:yes gene_type:complete
MLITPKRKKDAEKYIKRFKKRFKKEFSAKIEIKYSFIESVSSIELPLLDLDQLLHIIDSHVKENTKFESIIVSSRKQELTLYRHVFCKIAHEMDYKWVTIGHFLSLNHATIINGNNSINNYLLIKDKNVTKIYEEIISHIKLIENYE